jgi:glutamine amidotransferase
MCELFGMSGKWPATVNFSLMKFAEHGGHTGPHQDGWGIGYYAGRDVRLIKEAEAAADSEWVRFVMDHAIRTPLAIAHVRRATMGAKTFANTQPFTRELAGRRHLFAHNGKLPGIFALPAFRPERFHPVGETDSEYAFCALLQRLSALWIEPDQPPPLEERLAVVTSFALELRALGPANFLYADGEVLFAHGHRRKQPDTGALVPPGLVRLHRQCRGREDAFAASGLSIDAMEQDIMLFASVPLTDEAWEPLTEGEIIVVSEGCVVTPHSR